MSPIKLGIGIPAYGAKVSMWHAQMWLTMGGVLASSAHRFWLQSINFVDACGIDVARNRLVEDALAAGCDWLLMMDADTWVDDGGDLLQMISDADKLDQQAVLGAPAARRVGAVVAPVPRRDPNDTRCTIFKDGQPIMPSTMQAVEEVDAAGAAAIAVNLQFLKGCLTPPWFAFFWTAGNTKPTLSEDHAFCNAVRSAGGIILADTRVKTRHLQRPEVTYSESVPIVPRNA